MFTIHAHRIKFGGVHYLYPDPTKDVVITICTKSGEADDIAIFFDNLHEAERFATEMLHDLLGLEEDDSVSERPDERVA